MAKSRDDKPSEWHVDTKGIGLAAVERRYGRKMNAYIFTRDVFVHVP